jgi:hypothetical protein
MEIVRPVAQSVKSEVSQEMHSQRRMRTGHTAVGWLDDGGGGGGTLQVGPTGGSAAHAEDFFYILLFLWR